jgi:hypothetical protein
MLPEPPPVINFGENNYTYIQDSWLSNSRLLAGVYRIIKYFDIVSLCAQKALEVPFFSFHNVRHFEVISILSKQC